ncbi:unnamed protein product [Blepharisma stoltei]|uniref:RING-type domain-containing protein n=1 Tax=Blepharisma stoltei TaxID=1481888 RepID=A0AAU9JNU3_9CILI|nr:unnamed protein product [Blepharisma stoltei]
MSSVIKLGCIIYVLMTDNEPCTRTLYFYLLLYATCEIYEILFSLIILFHRWCYARIPQSMLQTGQISYECLRVILTIAMTVDVLKDYNCNLHSMMGILSICLCIFVYVKYLFIILYFILFYLCWNRRNRVVNLQNNSRNQSDFVGSSLNEHLAPLPEGERCPICMEVEGGESVVLPCGHGFHLDCIKDWLTINRICPMCRAPYEDE